MKQRYKIWIYLFFILLSLVFILPFIMLIGISFSTEEDVARYGFSIIPHTFSLEAYEYVFANPGNLVSSYLVTIGYAFLGTALSVAIMAMMGYALSRDGFAYKKIITWFLLITMFFRGGITPEYVINTQLYHLQDNLLIYLLSGVVSAYTVFVFKTFFSQLPKSLIESASLDGASEMQILTRVTLPLSKAVLATFYLFGLLSRWNNFEVSLYYIMTPKWYSLQYLLQQVLNEAKMLEQMIQNIPGVAMGDAPPAEIIKFAICILAAVPMLIVFPFFQRYFSKGVVVGAVKG